MSEIRKTTRPSCQVAVTPAEIEALDKAARKGRWSVTYSELGQGPDTRLVGFIETEDEMPFLVDEEPNHSLDLPSPDLELAAALVNAFRDGRLIFERDVRKAVTEKLEEAAEIARSGVKICSMRDRRPEAIAVAIEALIPDEPLVLVPDDWRCPECDCRSYARVHEMKRNGKYGDGPMIRCVNCKQVYDSRALPKTPDYPEPCPVCGGDCSSANPPVIACPMRD